MNPGGTLRLDRREGAYRWSKATTIQTFLIAAVRGYTHFTQERGGRGCREARRQVRPDRPRGRPAPGGSVIELRGDEALAVFSSARQAVLAAVELQERMLEETLDDPELPLPVGIGLDAGEAAPVESGYRGGALNLAARLCGEARAGEILASRGVTHLARRVEGVRYVDRGRVPLKSFSSIQVVPNRSKTVDDGMRDHTGPDARGPLPQPAEDETQQERDCDIPQDD